MNADVQMSHMGFHNSTALQKQLAALWHLILPRSLSLSYIHSRDLCIYSETIKYISTPPPLQSPPPKPQNKQVLPIIFNHISSLNCKVPTSQNPWRIKYQDRKVKGFSSS